jgi:hypothetical protein
MRKTSLRRIYMSLDCFRILRAKRNFFYHPTKLRATGIVLWQLDVRNQTGFLLIL